MYISSSGNVGIGTSTPTLGTLQVNGNVYAASFTGSLQGTATTASYVLNAVSSSFATTASYATNTANFANTDLTLTANRTHNTNKKQLWITSDTSSTTSGQYLLFTEPLNIMGQGVTSSFLGLDDSYLQFTNETITGNYTNISTGNTSSIYIANNSGYTGLNINVNNEANFGTFIYGGQATASIHVSGSATCGVGIGTETPKTTLDVNGSFSGGYRNISATVIVANSGSQLRNTDFIVTFSSPTPGVGVKNAIILPAASPGRMLILNRISGSAACAISGSGGALINSGSGYNYPVTLYTQRTFVSDGVDWYTEP